MRCICCNRNLSDYESTLKHAITGEYLDTCGNCLSEIAWQTPLPVRGRNDLIHTIVPSDEDFDVDNSLMDIEYGSNLKGNYEIKRHKSK